MRKRLRRQLKKARKVEFDLTKLEGDFGIHELRRHLRRIRHSAVALDGLVQIGPRIASIKRSPKEVERLEKYVRFPTSSLSNERIVLLRREYEHAVLASAELADVKEPLEHVAAIAGAYRKSGVAKGPDAAKRETLRLLGLSSSEPDRLVAEAQRILAGCIEADLFEALRLDLKRQGKPGALPPWRRRKPQSQEPKQEQATQERAVQDRASVPE